MTKKRQIDRMREAAASVQVGAADDSSPITAMVEVNGILHVVKAGGIYQIIMADDIDPERSNPKIPHAQQRVISYGSDTDFVCKIFLTAHALLRSWMPEHVDSKAGLAIALDILKDVASMHDVDRRIQASQNDALGKLHANQRHKESFAMPTAGDLESGVKTFLQRAAFALNSLAGLARVFFPDCKTKGYFAPIRDAAADKFGSGDMLVQLLTDLNEFTRYVRDARNCVEHPKATEAVVVRDFSLRPDLSMLPPSIEVIHPNSPQPPMPILSYMTQVREQITDMTELLLALLCDRHIQGPDCFPIQVLEIPESHRQFKAQRFGYGACTEDGQLVWAS